MLAPVSSIGEGKERMRIERRCTDEAAVNVWHCQQFCGVFRLHASAIQDRSPAATFSSTSAITVRISAWISWAISYRHYYSDAQRTDFLSYLKYDWKLDDSTTWSNQLYYHRDNGVGVVAGPIGVAGLPALFGVYYPNQNLKQVFGNSGYATRTTEYKINRGGLLSTLRSEIGAHQLEAGLWLERNLSSAYRRWYALDANNPSTPYDRPSDPLITQYGSAIANKVVQLHAQDEGAFVPT